MKHLLLILVGLFITSKISAQWSTSVALNTPICSTPSPSTRAGIVATPDGLGGMYIAWIDSRTSGNGSVYIQRVNLSNTQIFTKDGLLVADPGTNISYLSITPDGVGGAILAWQTNDDIFAQRVTSAGAIGWANPVALTQNPASIQSNPQIAIVNTTEAIVVFLDDRNGNTDIYLNKILTSTGALQFVSDMPVCTATGTQSQVSGFPDGSGGVYVSWTDVRGADNDIYALHVKNDGTAEAGWAANGTVICNASGVQGASMTVLDGTGGIYIAWEDSRSGNSDIYAQRSNAAGTVTWAPNGVVVCNATGNQLNPQVTPAADGMLLTWTDARSGTSNRNIFAQKMAVADGAAVWTANGVTICNAADQQPSASALGLKIVPDGVNGAIIVWNDQRLGSSDRNIFAQRINTAGTIQWTANGVVISSAGGNQGPDLGAVPITSTNGAYIVWQDSRSGTINGEIYASVTDGTGNLSSSVYERIALEGSIKAYPVPASKDIYLSLSKVKPGTYTVQVIDISGRMLLQNKTAVSGTEGLIETRIEQLQSGVYFIKLIHESSKTESVFRFTKQ